MTLTKYTACLAIAAAALAMVGCDKDGEKIYTPGGADAELESGTTDIVLDAAALDALSLTLYWNENGEISLSDPLVAPPANAVRSVVQLAADEAFTNVVDDNIAAGVFERQYTCRELNNLAGRLGLEGGVKAPLYVRVKSTLAANIPPKYSNTLSLSITPYFIDMSVAFVLDAGKNDTGRVLASPESDGVYRGFLGAGSWENWWLREGNYTEWGNDGVTGTAFVMGNSTTGLDVWNFWFPGVAGCYYTVADTRANEWSALLLPELNIGGDITGVMAFDRRANKWTYTFDAQARTYSITLSAAGKQYNSTTGTDDAAAIDTPCAFSGDAAHLSFAAGGQATPIAIAVGEAGETTLTLDLNDPNQWTLTASAGSGTPVETVPEYLYLSGIYDPWDFESTLRLYNEDNRTYGGAHYVDSEWGYRIYAEKDNWDDYYSMVAGGNGYEGGLLPGGEGNIAAPEAGFYLFDVNIGELKYKLTAVSKVAYTGLNDDWTLSAMTPSETKGVYTAEVEKKANTPWGVKIVLNDNWDLYFGGNGVPGELALYRDGFEGDNELENGIYILTVDLSKGTYNYSKK